jgi:HD-GYP domain-containing protein (c-di-GMP phosphodiesterase class II)
MKEIPVKSLKAGLIFTEPVFIEENNLLVPQGIAIRKKDLERLNSWGIVTVSTEGELVPEVQPQGIIRSPPPFPLPVDAPEQREAEYRSYTEFIADLTAFFKRLVSGTAPDVSPVDSSTRGIIRMVQEYPERLLTYVLNKNIGDHDFAKSAVNTGILSYLIAAELQLPTFRIFQIVTAALLHDVGMFRLPQGIMGKKGALNPEELKQIKTHPLHSYRIVYKELLYPENVGRIVVQHHERWDGEGYPQGLAGDAIDMGARILSVADAFEAMIGTGSSRNSMIASQAVRNILADNSKCFDPSVLNAFIRIMGIYPVGSLVLLNNGALAQVVEVRKNAPLRPRIALLTDGSGRVYGKNEGEIINLLEEQALFILRAVEGRDASKAHA